MEYVLPLFVHPHTHLIQTTVTPREIRDILPPELPDGAVMYRAVGGKDIGAGALAAHRSLQAPAAGQLPEDEFRHRAAADIARANK